MTQVVFLSVTVYVRRRVFVVLRVPPRLMKHGMITFNDDRMIAWI